MKKKRFVLLMVLVVLICVAGVSVWLAISSSVVKLEDTLPIISGPPDWDSQEVRIWKLDNGAVILESAIFDKDMVARVYEIEAGTVIWISSGYLELVVRHPDYMYYNPKNEASWYLIYGHKKYEDPKRQLIKSDKQGGLTKVLSILALSYLTS